VREFAEFLASQPPFDALDGDDLERLASAVEVEYFIKGAEIVAEGTTALDHIYVVRTGEVEVVDRGRVVDMLGPGDTFGHISLLTGLAPALSVRASEDTLCYRLPDARKILHNPERLSFAHFGTMIARQRLTDSGVMSGRQAPVERHMRAIVWCDATDSVRDIASKISRAEQSCALVRLSDGIGIVTDRDFRARIATGEVGLDQPVAAIATHPVISVESTTPLAKALLQMVDACVHHLVVEDEAARPVGILRAIDVASVEVRDPLLIRAAIESSESVAAMTRACQLIPSTIVELHDSGVPAGHIGALLAAVTDAVLRRLVYLVDTDADRPVPHSWLVLGSLARHEPLPGSDVDTAIVWADPLEPANPADQIREVASRVLDAMETCGLRRCPDGANADNPLFSRPRSAWRARAQAWISNPTLEGALLLASMAADTRPITQPAIGRAITDSIRETARGADYLDASLRLAIAAKPPTGFVRDFVVEHSGQHRGRLNLKQGGLAPVSSLGRWLAIACGDVRGSTIDRIERAGRQGLLTNEESEMLGKAFENIYETLLDVEVRAIRGGITPTNWIDPRELDALTRRHLRESFKAISAVQNSIEGDWKTRLQ
jgi:CBS domain-containing protein